MKILKLSFMLLIALLIGTAFAAPHSYLPLEFNQPDGSKIALYASGDEFHNWLHDKDNYTIMQDDAGWYVYARQDGEKVAPTDLKVGNGHPTSRMLSPGINLSQNLIKAKYERYRSMQDYSNGRSPSTGQFNNLVVFIRFSDDPPFSQQIPYYDNIFNNSSPNANSMKNYFIAASYNQLLIDSFFYPIPNGDIIVSYVDSHPRNYYRKLTASNPIGYDDSDYDERTDREHTLLANATAFVANQIPTSIDIDGDNDGYVDNVCFIIQGSPDGWAELLWPHRWVLYGATALIHGAQVWDFNFQLENSLSSSGASVLSHEMFHSLSAPDLYRYNDNTITPIGGWDLMASNSNPPQHMSAWMKYRYGQWLPAPPIITQSGTYTLSPVASSSTNNIFRINSWRANESYVLEYRKPSGIYDDTLPGQGLLVYRLDTRESGNAQGPPDELYIYRPGGTNTTTNGSLSSAAYSQQNGRTRISESTVPNGFTGNNLRGGLNVYNIGLAGETIAFDVKISDIQLTSPVGGETWFSGSNKTITWKAKTTTGSVNLEYSTNGGQTWIPIVANAQNSGTYTWMGVPVIDSHNCFIKITLTSNNHSDMGYTPFNIIGTLAIPQTVYPENQAINVATNPLFTWQSVMGATSYHFQLSTDIQFENSVYNLLNHPQASFQANNLTPFTTYYWRVASFGEVGSSMYSEPISFTTGDLSEAPGVPALISPANFAGNQPLNPQLSWSVSALATNYRIQIASDSYFTILAVDNSDIIGTSFVSPNLNPNSSYYWRVAGLNSYASSNFSSARRFYTGTAVDNEDVVTPAAINSLAQNSPNPFNPNTRISFSIKNPDKPVSLMIYNTRGQLIRTLFQDTPKTSTLFCDWDGKDDHGQNVSSGIYLYRLRGEDFSISRKMLLTK